jgi:frataxin-like iron-binding protein CyaY
MSNPFVDQVVSAFHDTENVVGEAGQAGQAALQVAAGHTSLPIWVKNNSSRQIWVAIRAQGLRIKLHQDYWVRV